MRWRVASSHWQHHIDLDRKARMPRPAVNGNPRPQASATQGRFRAHSCRSQGTPASCCGSRSYPRPRSFDLTAVSGKPVALRSRIRSAPTTDGRPNVRYGRSDGTPGAPKAHPTNVRIAPKSALHERALPARPCPSRRLQLGFLGEALPPDSGCFQRLRSMLAARNSLYRWLPGRALRCAWCEARGSDYTGRHSTPIRALFCALSLPSCCPA